MILARRTGVLVAVAAVLLLAGCGGPTQQGRQARIDAETRWNGAKSGVEWSMANQAYEVGDLDTAHKHVMKSLSLTDQVPAQYILLAKIMLEKGSLETAENSLRTALAIDPTQAEAYYVLGLVYERMSLSEQAFDAYSKAFELDGNDVLALIASVETLINMDKLDRAQRLAEGELSHHQYNSALRQVLGQIEMIRGDVDAAVALFEEAALLAPDESMVEEDLIGAMFAAGRFAECEFRLQQMLDDPDHADRRDLRHMWAECLRCVDREYEAREILMELVEEDRTDRRAWIALGHVAHRLHDERRVRQAGDRLIGLSPQEPEGYALRALWEWEHGTPDKALRMIEKAASLAEDDPEPDFLAGMWLLDLGRRTEALAHFVRAKEIDPTDDRLDILVPVTAMVE